MFVKFDPPVQGTTKNAIHSDWIEILSFSWGVSSQKVHIVRLTRSADRTSLILAEDASVGKRFSSVVLDVCNPKTSATILKFEMINAGVSNVEFNRATSLATITLYFDFAKLSYPADASFSGATEETTARARTLLARVLGS
jgi:type VI protein secretion system component Hcp